MPKSLDDLENDPNLSLPEFTYKMCVNGKLIAKLQKLQAELGDLAMDAVRDRPVSDDGETKGPPPRLGQRTGDTPRMQEIKGEIGALWDEMAEYTGELRLRLMPPGAWQQWLDDHPARDKNERDLEVAGGLCNADDLIASIPEFAIAWNDEPMKSGRFDSILRPKAVFADMKAIARQLVQMHENGVDLPKLRLASLGLLGSEID